MPIGTASTQTLLKVKSPPVRTSQQSQKNSILAEILTFLAVQIVIGILAPITGGASSAIALGLGFSDLTASIISAGVSFSFDFLSNQIYDVLKKQSTFETTLLNLLPGFAYANQITRGARTAKVLKIAKETGLLEKWGVDYAPNFEKLAEQLKNQKLLTRNNYLWDFSEFVNKETLLTNISSLATIEFQNQFKILSFTDIEKYFILQEQISKIHPSLVPKARIYNKKQAQQFLRSLGTTIQDVTDMSYEEFLNFAVRLQSTGKGSSLIIALGQMRETLLRENFLKELHKDWVLLKNKLKKYNPSFQVKKLIKDKFAKANEKLLTLRKLSNERIRLEKSKTFTKIEEKILIKGQIIPLRSQVFLGYRVRKFGLAEDVALTIFYKNPKYKPITIITTINKVTEFALSPSPFRYYMYESGWSFGWGIKKNKIMKVISFLPPSVQQAIVDGYQVWLRVNKLMQQAERFRKIIEQGQTKAEAKKYLQQLGQFTWANLIISTFGVKIYKVSRIESLTSKYARTKIIKLTRKKIKKTTAKYKNKKRRRL